MENEIRDETQQSQAFQAEIAGNAEAVARYNLTYTAGRLAWRWVSAEMEKDAALEYAAAINRDFLAQKERADLDPMTGLYNKVAFQQRVEQTVSRSERRHEQGNVHSLLILDLDNFKLINDTIGHPLTDSTCLNPVAEIIKSSIRQGDLAARWGGEEFVILLLHADLDGAYEKAAEIQEQVNKIMPPSEGASLNRLGVSIGIAQFPQGAAYDTVLTRADEALLVAKTFPGKNRIECAEDVIHSPKSQG